jgi:hypothetical protein
MTGLQYGRLPQDSLMCYLVLDDWIEWCTGKKAPRAYRLEGLHPACSRAVE